MNIKKLSIIGVLAITNILSILIIVGMYTFITYEAVKLIDDENFHLERESK